MRRALLLGLALVAISPVSVAEAFHDGRSFEASSTLGGGDGRYFSGSPRSKRYDCTVCHTGPSATVRVASLPAELIDEGVWRPNITYQIAVELIGESQGLASKANHNGLVVEVVDALGEPVEGLAAANPNVVLAPSGEALWGSQSSGLSRWTFEFTSPSAGVGPMGLFLSVVDGNGAGDADEERVDLEGDATYRYARPLCLLGSTCSLDITKPEGRSEARVASQGCVASGSGGGPLGAALIFLGGLVFRRTRARRA